MTSVTKAIRTPMTSFALGAFCALTFASTLCAQEQPQQPWISPSYIPELSLLMGLLQLRQFKLSFAAEVENWDLAKYEVAQVRESLGAAARFYPEYENVPQAKLIYEVSNPALTAIDKAIAEKNRLVFKASFNDLTNSCNSCHRQTNHGFIVIRVPTRSPFSNQEFGPPARR